MFASPNSPTCRRVSGDHRDLLHQKGFACFDFIRFRVAVVRGAALDYVRDVNVTARQSCRLQEIVQEFSCSPDEWFSLLVFIEARCFPHEHHARVWIPHTKHHLGSAHLRKLAALAVMQRLAEFEEGHGGEVEQLKSSMDFRRADFSCQWKRNVRKMVAHICSAGGVRGGKHAIHETARVRFPRLYD